MARRAYTPATGQLDGAGQVPGDAGNDAIELASVDIEAIGWEPTSGSPEQVGGEDTSGDASTEEPRKRRARSDAGQKRGPRKSAGAKASISLEALERLLFSSHMILAAISKTQELALSEDEARELAKASAAVSAHYKTEVAAKTLDWINLAQCAGFIYVSRIVAIKARKSQEKAERKAAAPQPNGRVGEPVAKPEAMPTDLYGTLQ